MTDVDAWSAAMDEALVLAVSDGAPFGVNPRVGCVIVDPAGDIVGRGYHRGAGTPHAEVVALMDAAEKARGSTAVVTLEPCAHTGRTGPCTQALLDAGVVRVVFAQQDPTSEAGGGGAWLATAGLDVIAGVRRLQAEAVNEAWTFAVTHGRPLVTWKVAASLDGRVAGPDGGPTAITGAPALSRVHDLRAQVGAVLIGTGTALADDPALTVRIPGRETHPAPLRVVLGSRPIPSGARVLDSAAPTLVLDDPEPASVLSTLFDRGVRHVLLEGGPTLASAFLEARLVDRVEWYIAPVLLGAGPVALPPAASRHLRGVDVTEVGMVGEDVRIAGWVRYDAGEA